MIFLLVHSVTSTHQVGDVVVSCDFENVSPDSSDIGCDNVALFFDPATGFQFGSTSASADTGPSADHTSGSGKCHNRRGREGHYIAYFSYRYITEHDVNNNGFTLVLRSRNLRHRSTQNE